MSCNLSVNQGMTGCIFEQGITHPGVHSKRDLGQLYRSNASFRRIPDSRLTGHIAQGDTELAPIFSCGPCYDDQLI